MRLPIKRKFAASRSWIRIRWRSGEGRGGDRIRVCYGGPSQMPYKSGVIVWRDLNPVCSSAARMRFAIILLALDLACDSGLLRETRQASVASRSIRRPIQRLPSDQVPRPFTELLVSSSRPASQSVNEVFIELMRPAVAQDRHQPP